VAGRRVTRWLLLVCTVFGLTAMHTLGHAGTAGHGHPGAAVSPAQPMTVAPATMPELTAATCTGDHCPGMPAHSGLDGWSVCLAVLTGLATVALLAILLFMVIRPAGSALRRCVPPGRLPRAPPRHTAGLTITAATVLRI
jgi:hypothetical protein